MHTPQGDYSWLWWIPALPLLGSGLCALLHFLTLRSRGVFQPKAGGHGHDHGHAHAAPAEHADHGDAAHAAHDDHGHAVPAGIGGLAHAVASLAMLAAFVLSIVAVQQLANGGEHLTSIESSVWHWIDTGSMSIDISIVIDRLSAIMVLVVTGVGFLIHVYAGGYMKGDAGFAKFFCYLNLFVFSMLMLILSSSLLGLFVGWEGVGLCSYLLIGFWYEKGWPAEAGQKAFVMNRIGDASFLIGSFLLVHLFGTLDLSDIAAAVQGKLGEEGVSFQLMLAGLLLFGGACGKSAQLPLFTWLPDAMAGPTPVSALIHAATMVTAGIYLVVRLNPVFAASPELLLLIGTVGALTAFVAGSTALVQRDIKKVLAYSTVSQLGYMFLALGSGAFASAIFHLATHAFFKALLFLGAGSVIHGMHHEQDMHKMGNLRKYMPQTFLTFMVGAAALSGLPLLSGFFSKDEILAHTFANGGVYYVLWGLGLLTAMMTAFYTWRMVALTFFGPERFDTKHFQPHESPAVMTLPLMVLAVLSVVGGALSFPPVFPAIFHPEFLHHWLHPVLEPGEQLIAARGAHHLSHATEWALLGLGSVVALALAHAGFRKHMAGIANDEASAARSPIRTAFLSMAWGLDAAYQKLVVGPVRLLALMISAVVDGTLIDGFVNGAGEVAVSFGTRLRTMASGNIAAYGLWMGAITALIALILVWQR